MAGSHPRDWVEALAARLGAANSYTVDGAVAAVVAIPVSAQFAHVAPGGATVLGGLLNAGTVLPLAWRRRAPFAMALAVALFAVLVSAYHRPGQELQYGALVASYTVADLGRRRQRWVYLALLLLILGPGALLAKSYDVATFLLTLLLPLSFYLLGVLIRINRERAEALAERAMQLTRGRAADMARAVAQERARIARDMHDLLAHSVSIMVVQAEAAPVVVRTDPDRAERAFDDIAETGRAAMVQLRRILGVLDAEHDLNLRSPPPEVSALPGLVAGLDRAGLRAALQSSGRPRPLPADTEVAVYRIVQEALTNAVKHAGPCSVTVWLDWTDEELVVTVTDDGNGPARAMADPRAGGHGLIGIRERAAACGGDSLAGPAPGGGFRVRARLPYAQQQPAWARPAAHPR